MHLWSLPSTEMLSWHWRQWTNEWFSAGYVTFVAVTANTWLDPCSVLETSCGNCCGNVVELTAPLNQLCPCYGAVEIVKVILLLLLLLLLLLQQWLQHVEPMYSTNNTKVLNLSQPMVQWSAHCTSALMSCVQSQARALMSCVQSQARANSHNFMSQYTQPTHLQWVDQVKVKTSTERLAVALFMPWPRHGSIGSAPL